MNRLSKRPRALGFDRGTSLRHPRLRRSLSAAVRILLISSLLGACGVAVFAAAGSSMMSTFVPAWISGGSDTPQEFADHAPSNIRYESPPPPSLPGSLRHEWTVDGLLRGFPISHADIAISADGSTVATVDREGLVEIWSRDLSDQDQTWARTLELRADSQISSLSISRDGKTLAAGFADGRIGILRVAPSERFRTVQSHRGPVLTVALHPTGGQLYSGGSDGFLRSIALPGLASPAQHAVGEPIRQLEVSPDSTFLALLGGDSKVRIHSVLTLAPLCTPGVAGTEQISISPDGRRLACLMNDGTAQLCRSGNLDQITSVEAPSGPGSGWRVAGWHSDRSLVLVGLEELVHLSASDGAVLNRGRAALRLDWLMSDATLPAPIALFPGGAWPTTSPFVSQPMEAIWPGGMVARFGVAAAED